MELDARWLRLAELLRARRVIELGIPNRTEFARSRGLRNPRLLLDLETGKRDNYDSDTLLSLVRWYDLPADRLAEILGDRWPLNDDIDLAPPDTDLFCLSVRGERVAGVRANDDPRTTVYQVAAAIAKLAGIIQPEDQRTSNSP